ncbi:hypothetical protein V6N12_031142 [Hibiscus sabdariffa]|uniref:Uncharacterized protein n=1 Tax=Hibiscus sabdariffa TaxID=183260 RepID=A0ABR2E827_9ROSI
MMGHCGMTFAAIGGVYIGVEQLLQNYMMKRDFANDDERRHCVGDTRGMVGFASFVEEVGLLDLPASGKKFTWFGASLKTSRLDRFLVSPAWVEQFRGLEQFVVQRGVSDHAPLEKMGHVKLMESKWRQISEEASSPLSILEKMRLLKGFLKVWNTESFGSVDLQIEVTTELLNDLEGRDKGVEELIDTRHQL